jgi:hypothetical protein
VLLGKADAAQVQGFGTCNAGCCTFPVWPTHTRHRPATLTQPDAQWLGLGCSVSVHGTHLWARRAHTHRCQSLQGCKQHRDQPTQPTSHRTCPAHHCRDQPTQPTSHRTCRAHRRAYSPCSASSSACVPASGSGSASGLAPYVVGNGQGNVEGWRHMCGYGSRSTQPIMAPTIIMAPKQQHRNLPHTGSRRYIFQMACHVH